MEPRGRKVVRILRARGDWPARADAVSTRASRRGARDPRTDLTRRASRALRDGARTCRQESHRDFGDDLSDHGRPWAYRRRLQDRTGYHRAEAPGAQAPGSARAPRVAAADHPRDRRPSGPAEHFSGPDRYAREPAADRFWRRMPVRLGLTTIDRELRGPAQRSARIGHEAWRACRAPRRPERPGRVSSRTAGLRARAR